MNKNKAGSYWDFLISESEGLEITATRWQYINGEFVDTDRVFQVPPRRFWQWWAKRSWQKQLEAMIKAYKALMECWKRHCLEADTYLDELHRVIMGEG